MRNGRAVLHICRVLVGVALAVFMFPNGRDAMAAAPTWLEISGGGLKLPIVLFWEDVPGIRALDWTWAVACYQCDPDDLLDTNSPRRVDPPPGPPETPYVLRWKFGPPVTAREVVTAEWRYDPPSGDGTGVMQLRHHVGAGLESWFGMWFRAKPENDKFLLGMLLDNGCTRGGGIACVPPGQEHSFVRIKWTVIR